MNAYCAHLKEVHQVPDLPAKARQNRCHILEVILYRGYAFKHPPHLWIQVVHIT
eukprot:UN01292